MFNIFSTTTNKNKTKTTTTMTKINCPECGQWDYKGENKKGQKATCPKCTRKVTIPTVVLCLLALFTVGYSYAEQQATVTLPLETPFAEHNCISYGVEPLNDTSPAKTSFVCYWDWYVDPRITEEVNHIINDPEATPEEKAHAIEALVIANPFVPIKDQVGIGDELNATIHQGGGSISPEPIVTEKLAQCLRGFDRSHEWGAFVDTQIIPSWLNKTREEFTERDGLAKVGIQEGGKNLRLLNVLKAIEECVAIQRYVDIGLIGEREAFMAVSDRLNIGKFNLPVPQVRGNEGMQKPDTDSNLYVNAKALEAQRAKEFACSEANQARHLCQGVFGFYGINRGITNAIVSKDVVVNVPNDPMSGLTAVDIYAMYQRAVSERVITDKDRAMYQMEINQVVCDNYFGIYKHQLGTDDFPEWLRDACIAGTKSTQFDLKERHALE